MLLLSESEKPALSVLDANNGFVVVEVGIIFFYKYYCEPETCVIFTFIFMVAVQISRRGCSGMSDRRAIWEVYIIF